MSTPASTKQLEPRRVDGLLLGSYGNCMIKVWSGRALTPEMDAAHEYAEELCALWPDGLAFLIVVESDCAMPRAEERKAISAFYKKMAPRLLAMSQVAEGTSLWAVMARSVFTALQLMERRAYPSAMFALPSEAIEWLYPYVRVTGPSVPAAELSRGMMDYLVSIRSS
jgi:hypothetical protein